MGFQDSILYVLMGKGKVGWMEQKRTREVRRFKNEKFWEYIYFFNRPMSHYLCKNDVKQIFLAHLYHKFPVYILNILAMNLKNELFSNYINA